MAGCALSQDWLFGESPCGGSTGLNANEGPLPALRAAPVTLAAARRPTQPARGQDAHRRPRSERAPRQARTPLAHADLCMPISSPRAKSGVDCGICGTGAAHDKGQGQRSAMPHAPRSESRRALRAPRTRLRTVRGRPLGEHMRGPAIRKPALQQQAAGARLEHGAVNIARGCRAQVRRHGGTCCCCARSSTRRARAGV